MKWYINRKSWAKNVSCLLIYFNSSIITLFIFVPLLSRPRICIFNKNPQDSNVYR